MKYKLRVCMTAILTPIMALALAVNAYAQHRPRWDLAQSFTFMTGNTLLERCRTSDSYYASNDIGYSHGYITGVFDRLMYSHGFARVCPSTVINETQAWDVVVNYLASHPVERGLPADVLVAMAINEAWNCDFTPSAREQSQ